MKKKDINVTYKYIFWRIEKGEEFFCYDCKPDDIMKILINDVVLIKVEKSIIKE